MKSLRSVLGGECSRDGLLRLMARVSDVGLNVRPEHEMPEAERPVDLKRSIIRHQVLDELEFIRSPDRP